MRVGKASVTTDAAAPAGARRGGTKPNRRGSVRAINGDQRSNVNFFGSEEVEAATRWSKIHQSFPDAVRSANRGEQTLYARLFGQGCFVDRRTGGAGERQTSKATGRTTSFRRTHGSSERLTGGLTFQTVVMAQKELHSSDEKPWYVLDPHTPAMTAWSATAGAVLLFVAVFTPFEVAFLPSPIRSSDALFVIGRIVDAVFIVDMLLQFLLMVPRLDERGKWEARPAVLAGMYLRSWFALDVCALSASIFDTIPIFLQQSRGSSTISTLTFLRVLRVLRLVKLLRLVRASHLIKKWSSNVPTPRATVTVVTVLVQCLYTSHLCACFLALTTVFEPSVLQTWYATHGYCRPAILSGSSSVVGTVDCAEPGVLYMACLWWGAGMLMGAPISMSANKGPYERYFHDPDDTTALTLKEQAVVLTLKACTAFMWTTVIARFVQVYNSLDPDSRDFKAGWDALNRFIAYFRIPHEDALELRRYYIERTDEAKAKSRMRVMNDFSPMLQEKSVWKLNRDWLVKVPCFSLVVERMISRPGSGMERFLVKVALGMQPSIFVPKERPPSHRLYIITSGVAIFKGNRCGVGDSWGAEDVLLTSRPDAQCYKAIALTYLHVLWIGVDVFEQSKRATRARRARTRTRACSPPPPAVARHRTHLPSPQPSRVAVPWCA